MSAAAKSPRCISCGCTETNACLVVMSGQTQRCAWILVDRRRGEGLCSACATLPQLLYAVLARIRQDGMGVRELADHIGKSPTQVRHALEFLRPLGLVTVDGSYIWRAAKRRT